MVDASGFVYVTSSTESSNFPIVGGFDNSLGGTQDAVVAKFNTNLTSLLWSTYIGGTGLESGNSVQLSSTGDIFVAGGTTSSNLPNTSGTLNPTFKGGTTDGYVFKFTAPSYAAPVATYLGTNDYDQSYFVQLDIDDFVYVYGQTKGTYASIPLSVGTQIIYNKFRFEFFVAGRFNYLISASGGYILNDAFVPFTKTSRTISIRLKQFRQRGFLCIHPFKPIGY